MGFGVNYTLQKGEFCMLLILRKLFTILFVGTYKALLGQVFAVLQFASERALGSQASHEKYVPDNHLTKA